eukprot:5424692-Pyramimonas_sp.AAC.1
MGNEIHGAYIGREWAISRSRPAIRLAMVANHLMCMQVYFYATLNRLGRRTPRRFHIAQTCLGARRHATPPLRSCRLPGGSRASTDPAPLCQTGSSNVSCPQRSVYPTTVGQK